MNMKEPKMRLKGFTGEWIESTIGEISTSFSGGTPSAGIAQYYGGNIPFIRSGEINEDKTQLFITEEGLNSSSAKLIDKGTLLYALYGATSGEVGISKISGAINQAILAILPKKGFSSEYLSHYLRAKKNNIVKTLLQGGQGNLSGALVKRVRISLPSNYKEQESVSQCFTSIDILIQSTTKKIESLKQVKAASLQSMFPQEGETKPRVRFKGFEGEWEKVPLNDILEERNEKSRKTLEYPLMAFIAYKGVAPKGERYDRSALVNDVENKIYKKTEYGDFIYSSNNLETGSIGLNSYGKATISPVYSIFRCKDMIDFNFIGRRLVCRDIINEMIKWRQGVVYGQWRIHEKDFLTINILLPSYQEQTKIGDYFSNLDIQIILQTQRLEKLKQIKSACLDNMFV